MSRSVAVTVMNDALVRTNTPNLQCYPADKGWRFSGPARVGLGWRGWSLANPGGPLGRPRASASEKRGRGVGVEEGGG